ncbi:MAG: UbiA family prenyltransferase [Microbacteriaceae bacterium]|nr:UbiA family prenyltransferase [Microbacteriaceae bacterium]
MPVATRRITVALLKSSHPGPGVAVTLVAVLLGVGVGLPPERLLFVALAVWANQLSVGISNDWLDADRDRSVGRTDKPVARGDITAQTARTAALSTAAAAVVLTLPLGGATTVAHVGFIVSAWAYNLGMKRTIASVIPYLVSFGLLPLIVTLSLPTPSAAAPWAIGAGALLGAAAHFANVLPDLGDDRATGVRGFPHRLGQTGTVLGTWLVLAGAGVLVFLGASGALSRGTGGTGSTPAAEAVAAIVSTAPLIGLVVTLAIAVFGTVLGLSRPPSRLSFQLIIAAALVTVALLALAGQHLLA